MFWFHGFGCLDYLFLQILCKNPGFGNLAYNCLIFTYDIRDVEAWREISIFNFHNKSIWAVLYSKGAFSKIWLMYQYRTFFYQPLNPFVLPKSKWRRHLCLNKFLVYKIFRKSYISWIFGSLYYFLTIIFFNTGFGNLALNLSHFDQWNRLQSKIMFQQNLPTKH